MIRMDEATGGRPESRYGLPLYVCTLLLGSLTTILGLFTVFPDLPGWVIWSVPAVLGVLLGFVFAARPALGDSIRSLSHGGTLAWWLMAVALFVCASVVTGRRSLLLGLLALQLPALFTLVTERGYARYYVLCGFTVALVVSMTRPTMAVACVIMGVFLFVMTATMAYENFFFGMENAPPGSQIGISAWLPLRAAIVRFTLAAAVTFPLAWLTPVRPVPVAGRGSSGRNWQPVASGNIDTSFTLLETFLYTMILILMLLVLGAVLKWMRNRRRRRQSEMIVESLGVPVGEFRPVREAEPPPPPDPRTPIGQVVFWYNRFADYAGRRGKARKPSETPAQFRRRLVEECALPAQPVDTITSRFELARYAPGEVTEQEAQEFQRLVQETIARLKASADT